MSEPIRIELPTLYGMKSVNAYLFLSPEPVLIDCGEKSVASWEALQSGLSIYGLSVKDLKKVIITHAHVDHMGMAAKVAEESDAEIWVNEYSYDWAINTKEMWGNRIKLMKKQFLGDLDKNEETKAMSQMLETFTSIVVNAWDKLPVDRVKVFPMSGTINMGGTDWQIIYAPGHSITQTCFYQKEKKWLIAGDAVLRITPTPVFDFSIDNPEIRVNSLATMIETFQKLAKLSIDKVFPGHYEPFGAHDQLLQSQLDRIQSRKEETYTLIEGGKNRFFQLFDILYVNRLNMPGMSMLRGYLDLLIAEKRIEEVTTEGITKYLIK